MRWLLRCSFSLRALFVLVTGVAAVCGWVANHYRDWRQASQELRELGPEVEIQYAWRFPDHDSDLLYAWEQVVCLPSVASVTFHGKDWTPPYPKTLAMWDYYFPLCADVDDTAVSHLVRALNRSGCPKLTLTGTQITDLGLAELKNARSLEELDLTGCKISAAGLSQLKDMRLRSLDLHFTEIGDGDVPTLASLSTLTTLDVSETKLTLVGLSQLQSVLPQCTVIHKPYW
jgi:hypothetical protein